MESIIEITKLDELSNYSPTDKIFKIKRNDEVTSKLNEYFNKQILIQYQYLNGLYRKMTGSKEVAYELPVLPDDFKPYRFFFGGYKLEVND